MTSTDPADIVVQVYRQQSYADRKVDDTQEPEVGGERDVEEDGQVNDRLFLLFYVDKTIHVCRMRRSDMWV